MISSRPFSFAKARPIGEEIKFAGSCFYIHAPSGVPQDFSYTTDEQSHIKVPIVPGVVYNFPNGFGSLWLFHANTFPATDAQIVMATGVRELAPSGQMAYGGSAGPALWVFGSTAAIGPTNGTPPPAAGKRQRFLRLVTTLRADSACGVVGGTELQWQFLVTVSGTLTATISPRAFCPNASVTTGGPPLYVMSYDLGPSGFVLDPGKNVQVLLFSALTAGAVTWEIGYTEE